MGRARTVCRTDGCPHLAVRLGLCPDCATAFETARGSTTARGYGTAHQSARDAVAADVAQGKINCWRCGDPIAPGEPWDLGHDENRVLRGPEHASGCNRRAAGLRAHGLPFRPAEGRTGPRGTDGTDHTGGTR